MQYCAYGWDTPERPCRSTQGYTRLHACRLEHPHAGRHNCDCGRGKANFGEFVQTDQQSLLTQLKEETRFQIGGYNGCRQRMEDSNTILRSFSYCVLFKLRCSILLSRIGVRCLYHPYALCYMEQAKRQVICKHQSRQPNKTQSSRQSRGQLGQAQVRVRPEV